MASISKIKTAASEIQKEDFFWLVFFAVNIELSVRLPVWEAAKGLSSKVGSLLAEPNSWLIVL